MKSFNNSDAVELNNVVKKEQTPNNSGNTRLNYIDVDFLCEGELVEDSIDEADYLLLQYENYYDNQNYYDKINLSEIDCLSNNDLYQNMSLSTPSKYASIMDAFWYGEFKSMPNPFAYEMDRYYDNYDSLIHGVHELMDQDCTAISLHWGDLLVYKSQNEYCYYHTVYDTSKKGVVTEHLMLGDCMDPDDVGKIIRYYLKTGECYGHR
jgi:hypothetical protein